MGRFLTHWLTTAIALWVAEAILPGVEVRSFATLAVSALVLGLLNAVVKPVLQILAFPITLVTLGLFYLIVNGIVFWLAGWLVDGFRVDGILWAVLGSLIVSVVSGFIGSFAAAGRE